MIYLFDKLETLVKIADESLLVSWTHTVEINQFERASFELPADYLLTGIKYFGFFDDQGVFKLFRITQKVVDDTLYVEGMDKAESDLRHIGIIQDKRPQNVTADQALTVALENTGYQVGTVSGLPTVLSTNFYYISPVEALTKIIEKWGCEFRVRYTFVQNKITSRYIDLAKRFGKVSGKQFVYGDKALSIVREESEDEVVTALIGRGKGEELDSGGYGRRIEFKDIVWQTSKGNPVNKPKGQNYLLMESARGNYGLSQDGSMKHRWAVWIADQIEDPNELITATWEQLQKLSVPLTVFKASLVDMDGQAGYGDTVAVIRDEVGIAFSARIFKLTTDKLNANRSSVELGDYEVLKYHQRAGDRVSQAAEQLREEQSLYAQELTEFYKQIEEKLATKQVEIEEDLRVARQEFETAQAQAEEEAKVFQEAIQAEADALKKEGDSLKKSLQKEAEQRKNQAEEIRTEVREAVKKAREEAEVWQAGIAEEIGDVQAQAQVMAGDIAKADKRASDALSRANSANNLATTAKNTAEIAKNAAAKAGTDALAKSEEAVSQATTAKATADNTAKAVRELSVGGRNLFVESDSSPGFLNSTAGVSRQSTANKEQISDFISVQASEQLLFQTWVTIDNNQNWRAWQFYDAKKQVIGNRIVPNGAYTAVSGKQNTQDVIVVPEGAEFVRVSARLYDDGKIKVERGNIPTDWTPAPEDLDVKYDTFVTSVGNRLTTVEGRYSISEEDWQTQKSSVGRLVQTIDGDGKVKGLSERTAELTSGVNGITEKFTKLKVGAVNLLLDSNRPTLKKVSAAADRYFSDYHDANHLERSIQSVPSNFPVAGIGYMMVTKVKQVVSNTSTNLCFYNQSIFLLEDGEEYTLSCWARGAANGHRIRFQVGHEKYVQNYQTITSEWKQYKWTFTFDKSRMSAGDGYTRIYVGGAVLDKVGTVYTAGFQLERGNVATDWSPAEEDFRSEMAEYIRDSTRDFRQLKSTVEGEDGKPGLVSRVGTVEQTAGGLVKQFDETVEDSLAKKVSYNSSLITENAAEIEKRLTKTDLEKHLTDNQFTTLETLRTETAGLITQEITEVKGLIPTEVGGRNYIRNGDFSSNNTHWDQYQSTAFGLKFNYDHSTNSRGKKGAHFWYHGSEASTYYGLQQAFDFEGKQGDKVTVSLLAAKDGNASGLRVGLHFRNRGSVVNQEWKFIPNSQLSREYQSFSFTFTLPTNVDRMNLMLFGENSKTSNLYVSDVKFERGALATDWSPAPEDMVTSVDFNKVRETAQLYERVIGKTEGDITTNIARKVMTSELMQTEVTSPLSGLSTTVGQLSDNYAIKVLGAGTTAENRGKILSELNLNSGGVRIAGKLIHLDGSVTMEEAFVNKIKALEIDAGRIKTGTLNADLIGAGSIDATHIKSGIISADKLAVGLGGNLLYNPIFSNPTDGLPNGWRKWGNSSALNPNFNNTTNEVKKWALQSYLPSEYMLRFECNGAEKATMTCASSTTPVCPNTYYGGSVYLAVHRGKVKMVLRFNKSDGTYADRSSEWVTTQYSMSNGLTDAKRVFLKAQAPSDAVSVQMLIWLEGIDSQNNKIAFAARPMLEECTEHTTAPSAWQNAGVTSIHGGSIVTNTVTADKLVVNEALINKLVTDNLWAEKLFAQNAVIQKLRTVELDAGQLRFGKLDGGLIEAATIEAKHLKSGAITTEKIASEAITGAKIKANSISASHISTTGLTADLIRSGVMVATNGNLKFNLDNGFMLFENDNARIARSQSGYATQFLNMTNYLYANDKNRPTSGAVLGVNKVNAIESDSANFTGFRAFRSTKDAEINFTQIIGSKANIVNRGYTDASTGAMTGWQFTTDADKLMMIPMADTNARKVKSTIEVGDVRLYLSNGQVVSLGTILNAFEAKLKTGHTMPARKTNT